MKVLIFAITLSLILFANASKQLLCKAGEGSVLRFLVKDKAQSINCVAANSTDFAITKDQYDNIISRLETTENDLTVTKLAIIRSVDESTPEPRTASENRTQQLIDEAVNKAISKMLPTLVKEVSIRFLKKSGWVRSGDFVFRVFTERVDYDTATKRCVNHGGRLAAEVLRHPSAVRYIINGNFVVTYTDGREPWIGYNDIQRERYWRWVDGGKTNPLTTEWKDGEPNSNGGNEDCGSIAKTTGGKILLNDSPCSSKLHYICEIDLSQIA